MSKLFDKSLSEELINLCEQCKKDDCNIDEIEDFIKNIEQIDINLRDSYYSYDSALGYASKNDNTKLVKLLIDNFKDSN